MEVGAHILNRAFNYILKKKNISKFLSSSSDLRFSPINSYFTYDKISIGRNVFINRNAYFSGEISIGNNVLFGPYVFITDGYHRYDIPGKLIEEQGAAEKVKVVIDDDVWIGAKSSIMKGVHIHEGSIIGTMSVVVKDMPPYCICVGNPCRPIKYRYSDKELLTHLQIMNKSNEEIKQIISKRAIMFNEYKSEK